MVTIQEAELLRNTGPGTPIGGLFRRSWHPVLLSGDLPPDGEPLRVKVLGEQLVAFRDTFGRVGLLDESCPHRRMPLSDGINADGKLTCRYHSWAFDVTGRCVDDQPGADSVRVTAYPTVESAGIIWAYLGPPEQQPPSPAFAFSDLPAGHVVATRVPARGTYLKCVGEHIDLACRLSGCDAAEITVEQTPAGLRLTMPGQAQGHDQPFEVADHVLPACTVVPAMEGSRWTLIAVPIDAWNALRFVVAFRPDRPFTAAERAAIADQITRLEAGATAQQGRPSAQAAPADAVVDRLRRLLLACADGP